jgi:hypothetical protein
MFWCGKWMHKENVSGMSHERFFWSITQKESIFWEFSLDVDFWEYFKCQPTWCFFIDNWLNKFDLIMNFWNQYHEVPKGHWFQEHKW